MKLLENIKNLYYALKMNYRKFIFYFMRSFNPAPKLFRIKIGAKCLVLSHCIGAETVAMGGLIAQYPENFEVLSLTNYTNTTKEPLPEVVAKNKEQFKNAMQYAKIKGFKIFDIEGGNLKNEFNQIKKIDISDVDYVFVPNVFDLNPDAIALLRHFKRLLEIKEHKKTLQILMFENENVLAKIDYFADISNIEYTKRKMLEIYYPKENKIVEAIFGLNRFRGFNTKTYMAEGFMGFYVSEFLELPFD